MWYSGTPSQQRTCKDNVVGVAGIRAGDVNQGREATKDTPLENQSDATKPE